MYSARDLDFDGRVEMFEHYAGDGSVSEQEFQLTTTSDRPVRFYRDGVLWRKEMSQSFDGQLSMVKTYDAAGNHLSTARTPTSMGASTSGSTTRTADSSASATTSTAMAWSTTPACRRRLRPRSADS